MNANFANRCHGDKVGIGGKVGNHGEYADTSVLLSAHPWL